MAGSAGRSDNAVHVKDVLPPGSAGLPRPGLSAFYAAFVVVLTGLLSASFTVVTVVLALPTLASAAADGVLLRGFGPLGMPIASVVLLGAMLTLAAWGLLPHSPLRSGPRGRSPLGFPGLVAGH